MYVGDINRDAADAADVLLASHDQNSVLGPQLSQLQFISWMAVGGVALLLASAVGAIGGRR